MRQLLLLTLLLLHLTSVMASGQPASSNDMGVERRRAFALKAPSDDPHHISWSSTGTAGLDHHVRTVARTVTKKEKHIIVTPKGERSICS